MIIDIATLFPEMCGRVLDESIIGRARAAGKLTIDCHDIRAFTEDKHRRVDDSPYGGGMGMVMQPGPIYNCFRYLCRLRGVRPHVIYLSPKGQVFTQRRAGELANMNNLLLLCGHYEGVDQRIDVYKRQVLRCAAETGALVTAEEHSVIGGLGEAVCSAVCEGCPAPVLRVGVEDVFGCSGPAVDLLEHFGLTAQNLAVKARAAIALKKH